LRDGSGKGYAVSSENNGGSTVPRRQLGRKLKELREAARLTVPQAIGALEWSKPRLWRYETGQVPIHPNDVDVMCRVYGADSDVTEVLKELARQSKAKGWWHSYGDVPEWFELYLGMEAAASRMRHYESEIIPGLLQSPTYARALVSQYMTEAPADEMMEKRTAVRLRRQQILTRSAPAAPTYEVMLSEAALLRGFDSSTMVDQLTSLAAFTDRPNITIRVIPLSAGPTKAHCGPFVILDFPMESRVRGPEPTTIYQEQPVGALYLEKPSEVQTYSTIWVDLDRLALDQQASRALIVRRAKEWSQ
jgi:transcriptional regulator with XRE-family HTH domain